MRREYLTREVAYEKLKALTGQDFGLDPDQWELWIKEQQAAGVTFRLGRKR